MRSILITVPSWSLAGVLSLASTAPLLAQPAGGGPVPVVVAVDTSRSLTPQALDMVNDRLRRTLEDLPAETPAGLIAFDDDLRWVHELEAGPAAVAQALGALAPRGEHTLLHDAVFIAAQALEEGGVVLLATDGRDESSAITVEDIARRCEARNVRIVSVGIGARIELRALRRLALVTNGQYLGRIENVDAAEMAAALRKALDGVRAERARHTPPSAATDAAHREAVTAAPPPSPRSATPGGEPRTPWHGTWLDWVAVVAAASSMTALAAAALLRRRRREQRSATRARRDVEPRPAPALPGAAILRQELLEHPIASSSSLREVTGATSPLRLTGTGAAIETTGVLIERSTVTVREPGKDERSYELDPERAFAVGRVAEGNTLSIPDPALSSHHFRIVPAAERFFFIDVESTNGSSINGTWVNEIRELRSGDVIRAGLVELEFQSNVRHLATPSGQASSRSPGRSGTPGTTPAASL